MKSKKIEKGKARVEINRKHYLDHADARSNVNKQIRKQFIVVKLHKLFFTLHMSESFMAYCLLKHC